MNILFAELKNSLKLRHILLFIAIFVFIIWLGYLAQGSSSIQSLIVSGGYIGVFLFSVANGFNVFIPIVPASFLPAFTASGLSVNITILLFILGTTLADIIGFFLGKIGHRYTTKEHKIVAYFKNLRSRYKKAPLILLFFWAVFVPLPNEILLIPLGLLGYSAFRVLPITLLGNTLFTILTSFGVLSIFKFLTSSIG